MDSLKTLLVANRGEIAVRIIKTAKRCGIHTISVYTAADAASAHVGAANEAVLLTGPDSKAYLDGEQIIEIAHSCKANAIIPGYGFLSENSEFARRVAESGMAFVGPSPEAIEDFGIKHTARELASQANVPIVPGTRGLVASEDEAVKEAESLGFPVMLKATAGGGGMGLLTCHNQADVRSSFKTVQSRGESLFKNAGLFIEKFYPSSHHIEVQVFGNGQGKAIHFGERECSIQRRHQKVIEECPSPFVVKHSELRDKLCSAAVRLTESIKYGSAGTIEFLVDDESTDFFFLEMNTRLQVEHGITELCYGIDLVELMLRQADSLLKDGKGLDAEYLASLQPQSPDGAAVEVRIYAENPAKEYAPSPGILQDVIWKEVTGSRIDTWIHRGTTVTSFYDPLLAKAMVHAASRSAAIEGLKDLLEGSQISGPPTNMDFLASILGSDAFRAGNTITKFLSDFEYHPAAIDVIQGGAYTLIEDWPGRPTVGRGFGHSGPMDPLAFRIANALVGNSQGTEGLEITLSGPDLRFLGPAIIALCGAPMQAELDGQEFPMWTRVKIDAGQRLKIGKTIGGGCRSYLAIFGGLPSIATWFGSKSCSPMTGVGGYQGRALAAGDFLTITKQIPEIDQELRVPAKLIPTYPEEWDLYAMPGPYDHGFLTNEFIEEFYKSTFTISHNAARGGIRLLGPKPQWARADGGQGGAHPSNVIEYGYPLGSLNWTGDDPVLFPIDAPDFGGFVSSTTIIKADYWRLGQMKAGNKLRFHRVSYQDAIAKRNEIEEFLASIEACCRGNYNFEDTFPLKYKGLPPSVQERSWESAVIHQIPSQEKQPLVSYRQGGDDFILIEYGIGEFDLNFRCRAVALYEKLKSSTDDSSKVNFLSSGAVHVGMPCGNSLMLHYDSVKVSRTDLLPHLLELEKDLGDLSEAKFPSRKFKFPITFESKAQKESLQRYMETQRPYASYLPDPMEFVAKNNGLSQKELRSIFLDSTLMIVAVGFFVALPIALPIDPRKRIQCPKMNPSRVHTPAGQVGWGGSCMATYNISSPGGYMNTGLMIPAADILGFKHGYTAERPWLFDDFDQITFYEVSEARYDELIALFHSGRYVYEYEEASFDMAEHNLLLSETGEEVKAIRARQLKAQEEMNAVEKEALDRWNVDRERGKVSLDTVHELLNDPNIVGIEAPLSANVWKVEIEAGDTISDEQIVSVLEAMKLEIPVKADESMHGCVVEQVLVKSGDVVEAGEKLILLRRK